MFQEINRQKALFFGAIGNSLTEIEAVLNSRPLTYFYEDLYSGFTLTPGHFLATNRKFGLFNSGDTDYHCDEDFQPSKDSATMLTEIWKKRTKTS